MNLRALAFAALALAMAGCQSNNMAGMDMSGRAADTPVTYPVGTVDLKNTVCVVSGDPVGSSKQAIVYEGRVYHFCCPGLPGGFQEGSGEIRQGGGGGSGEIWRGQG